MKTDFRRAAARLAVAATIVVGLAACGDDEEDADASASGSGSGTEQTTTTTGDGGDEQAAGGDTDTFCSALIEFNTAVFEVELDETSTPEDATAAGEQLKPIWDEVTANAPDEVATTADELALTIDALVEGDAEAFNSDETFESYTALVEDGVEACDLPTTEVTAVDYTYEGLPATMEAGPAAVNITNEGSEEHEIFILKLPEGETRSAEEILAGVDPDSDEPPGQFVGVAFAPPGESSGTLVDLTPGRYIAACAIPVGGGEDGPPHFSQGMHAEFSVS